MIQLPPPGPAAVALGTAGPGGHARSRIIGRAEGVEPGTSGSLVMVADDGEDAPHSPPLGCDIGFPADMTLPLIAANVRGAHRLDQRGVFGGLGHHAFSQQSMSPSAQDSGPSSRWLSSPQ